MVFEHMVQGPLVVLGDELKSEPPDNVVNYVNDFHHRLHMVCATAHKILAASRRRWKNHRKTDTRLFEPGDKALVLLPNGMFTVSRKV